MKLYIVGSKKGRETMVVANSKAEVKEYVDSNKSEFSLDMSGYFTVESLKNKVEVKYDEYENCEVYIDGTLEINAIVV